MVTVDRVLPWRRDVSNRAAEIEPLVVGFKGRQARTQAALVAKAWELASGLHAGQMRRSGEAYISHPLAVAQIVAEQTNDPVTIAAALLHDVVEDTAVTLADLEREFPVEVATIVDGVTKLDRIHFASKEAQQAATMRKLFVAMANDLRVLIIKLADRLHTMRTLAAMSVEAQHRIARETLDVYAPLAHRLGMQDMRQQLEDLAFAALHPRRYAEIDTMVWNRTPERELYLTQVIEEVRQRLSELGIQAEVTGRPKHLWSIYEKMVVKGREFNEIFDLVGIRVLVHTVKDCYAAVGCIHAAWKPVQGRFKDFIAMPKFNNYQSLHTTVIGPQAKLLEVQIRTLDMNMRSEFGVAAHWRYKSAPADLEWLDRIVDWQGDISDPKEFMANLKVDLDQDEVMVFTPKGEVLSLPVGATPVDFAYAIHTEVGHSCIGAKVDSRLVSLDTPLHSGETVEIFTAKTNTAGPSRDWLDTVVTPKAQSRIRQWFAAQEREDELENGREEVTNALRVAGLPVPELLGSGALTQVAEDLNFAELEALYRAVGSGKMPARLVASRARRWLSKGTPDQEVQLSGKVLDPARPDRRRPSVGVHVEGMDDVLVRLARCCTPVPDDEIIGFHTRGRGVSVHRADCANAVSLAGAQAGRLVEVEWGNEHTSHFLVSIEVKAIDRTRLLRDVATVLADYHINILACQTLTGPDRVSKMRFDFEVGDPSHLQSAIAAVQAIESVYDARRVMPGGEQRPGNAGRMARPKAS
ncbi:MAG: bifunctional (p)ppGpp synthetase/guanosine-3',5'-bis(diphosphate) 3'-pyrophosphohydrolase [Acidimicrobiales bacterium]